MCRCRRRRIFSQPLESPQALQKRCIQSRPTGLLPVERAALAQAVFEPGIGESLAPLLQRGQLAELLLPLLDARELLLHGPRSGMERRDLTAVVSTHGN